MGLGDLSNNSLLSKSRCGEYGLATTRGSRYQQTGGGIKSKCLASFHTLKWKTTRWCVCFCQKKWTGWGFNPGPFTYEPNALTAALSSHAPLFPSTAFISRNGLHLPTNRMCPDDTGSYKACSKLTRPQSNISTSVPLNDHCSHNHLVWTDSRNHAYYVLQLGWSDTSRHNHRNFDWIGTLHRASGTWNDSSATPWSGPQYRTRPVRDHNCPWSHTRSLWTTCWSNATPARREGLCWLRRPSVLLEAVSWGIDRKGLFRKACGIVSGQFQPSSPTVNYPELLSLSFLYYWYTS